WGPRAIGDHGAPVSFPTLKDAYKKGTRGISWGPLLTPDPQANIVSRATCGQLLTDKQGGLTTHWAPGQ
ncbi:unnamed protein product, partial [Staurois parvus]